MLEPQPPAASRLATAVKTLRQSLGFRLGLGYFIAFLFSMVVMTILSSRLYSHQTELAIHEYGNTVARQLAQSCVDALVRSDLVSLHAQLEKLVEMDSIVDAAVYDMENHVLAQAGASLDNLNKAPSDAIRHFPAVVTFQDSIAGKVIVSLDTQVILRQKAWLYAYLVCGTLIALGLTIVLSMLFAKRANALYAGLVDRLNRTLASTSTLAPLEESLPRWEQIGKTLDHLDEHIRYLEQRSPPPKLAHSGKYTYKPTEGSYAELMIACGNLEQLQQQLHHRELQRLLSHFQEQLQKCARLYHGVNIDSPGNHILLRFLVNDVTDASLQAICCAVLLKGLIQSHPADSNTSISLEFRFAVHWHAHDERPLADLLRNHLLQAEYAEMLHLCERAKAGEILTTKGIKQSPSVAEHVKLDLISGESDADYYRVLRISDSYKKLLEQQIQQLNTADVA